jgi:hypothetical protein
MVREEAKGKGVENKGKGWRGDEKKKGDERGRVEEIKVT